MITYEITATVPEELVPEYEPYMRNRHIPDLMATGCFVAASFSRSSPGRYRIRYEAPDRQSLDRYLAEHARALRAHLIEHLGERVEITREIWTAIEVWG